MNSSIIHQVSYISREAALQQQVYNRHLTNSLARQEAAIGLLCQKIEESQSTQIELTRILGNFRHANVVSVPDKTALMSDGDSLAQNEHTSEMLHWTSGSKIRVQTSSRIWRCKKRCCCQCHLSGIFSVPHYMSSALGCGRIEFSQLPVVGPSCNLQSCRQKNGPFLRINYILPTWIAQRMISLWFSSAPPHGPEFVVRLARVVHYCSPVMEAIKCRRLEQLKSLMVAGLASPADVDPAGSSLLHV